MATPIHNHNSITCDGSEITFYLSILCHPLWCVYVLLFNLIITVILNLVLNAILNLMLSALEERRICCPLIPHSTWLLLRMKMEHSFHFAFLSPRSSTLSTAWTHRIYVVFVRRISDRKSLQELTQAVSLSREVKWVEFPDTFWNSPPSASFLFFRSGGAGWKNTQHKKTLPTLRNGLRSPEGVHTFTQ